MAAAVGARRRGRTSRGAKRHRYRTNASTQAAVAPCSAARVCGPGQRAARRSAAAPMTRR
ncbi:Uncharacterised protein [Bordetella pertussis]|nr:Uncharacterised protein [Bordetella pertussis]